MIRRLAILLATTAMASAGAQGGVLLQGNLDLEAWKTDTLSTLLTRNGGAAAPVYRLRLWGAVEPWRAVFIFANGVIEGGSGREFGGPGATTTLEQGGIRVARHRALVINAGRLAHPLGAFGSRVISTRNPLIGIPDGYSPIYPVGVMVSGERGNLDYRVAGVTLPLTHRGYVPRPAASVRPVVGVGFTPMVGLRIGASATDGSYLNGELTASQLAGRDWASYRQQIAAAEVQYGVGHFDVRGEFAYANFEVPHKGWIDGRTGYVEGRATLSPRVFVAARGEVNDYPFIRPTTGTTWISRATKFRDLELGAGFWFTASTILKASYRVDRWVVTPENSGFIRPGGRALAVQVSQGFDVADWVSRFR